MTETSALFIRAEQSILDRLNAASKANVLGYRLKSIESLPSDLGEADKLKEYITRFPAVWTVFNGWKVLTERSGGGAIVQASYTVVCAAKSQRNEGAARLGAGSAPGSLQIVADVVGVLLGNELELPITPLALGECRPLYTGELQRNLKASLYAVSFTTRMTLDAVPADVLQVPPPGEFTTFAVDWIAPGAGENTDKTQTLQTLETPA